MTLYQRFIDWNIRRLARRERHLEYRLKKTQARLDLARKDYFSTFCSYGG